ncbi:MAG: hypothetical protein JW787_01900 [Sedimentisphaerales bacterium]|nr:hypothetical protein [Sedimentisphaerales bacterium]
MAIGVSLNGDNFEQVLYNKEDAFEQLIAQNAQTIFGDKAIYIDTKKKVNTSSLGGTIPDGFLIDMSDSDDPQFYLVEVELQSHDFFNHIFPQITKFFAFYRDSKQRQKLIDAIFRLFRENANLENKIRESIGSREIYKFLKDMLDDSQNILIIIDGPKAEFKEIIDTYTDTWAKMVKVEIVNHFRQNNNDIITVEPPLQNLSFEDAITLLPEKEKPESFKYTEEFHLQDRPSEIVAIYKKLQQTFINTKETLRFNPTKYYIGVLDTKQIAYIQLQKKKIRLIVLMTEKEVQKILGSEHNNIRSHSESIRRYWGGNSPNCSVEIVDANHWDEIRRLIEQLVKKYE